MPMPTRFPFRPQLLGLMVASSLALAACGKQAPAPQTPPPPEVSVLTVAPRSVTLTAELPGRTAAYQVAEVRPQVGGIIQKRLFREGADVKAGEALYQIDPATYQASLDSARATLARAEATLATTENRARRLEGLVAIKAVSQQDYDDAVAAHKQSIADVAAARAAEQRARISLDYTRIAAPISGRISRSEVTPGALVKAEQDGVLTRIQQLDPIYVDLTRSSAELLSLRRALASGALKQIGKDKAQVKLLLEDGSPYPRSGELQFSDVVVDESTGTVKLRAVFPNPDGLLLPGMYVRAQLGEGQDEQAILVPQKAVTRNARGEAIAMVLGSDGNVQARVLTVDRSIDNQWLVRAGLQAGDQLITEGLQKVRPGAPARLAQPAPAGDTPAAPAKP